jgi:hypothetical protein
MEEAVTSELVSATDFPVIQGKYREFLRFGLGYANTFVEMMIKISAL